MQKPVMVVCPSPNYFIGQSLDPAWAVDLRGERQVRKRSNRFVRDRIGTYLEQVAKSPDPPQHQGHLKPGKPPTCMPPWKPEGPGAGRCHTLTSVSSEFIWDSFFWGSATTTFSTLVVPTRMASR